MTTSYILTCMSLQPLIIIAGPTASGKTDLAVELAKKLSGEIINADSRQIYKEIDIASAKPKLTTLDMRLKTYRGIPHHLFGITAPDKPFNVTDFQQGAYEVINQIVTRGNLPILVGGTGLWIRSVVENLKFPQVPPNQMLRDQLEESTTPHNTVSQRIHTLTLYKELKTLDPTAASFIDPKNQRRIIRALEVIKATGEPFSAQRRKGAPLFHTLMLGITWPMEELGKRIDLRVKGQLREGLKQEARNLFTKYDHHLPALSSISLKEWRNYFDGTATLEETVAQICLHNRQYAKRQMTWFKKDARIRWINNKNEAHSLIEQFLNR